MSRLLFELCGKNKNKRFSPFVWRTRLALCQKGLKFSSVPTTFLNKSAFEASGAKTVPVLKDGDKWISDSWEIACYLEDTYPDAPSIFGGEPGRAYAKFFSEWCFVALQSKIFLLIAPDIAEELGEEDKAYFLETRAKRIGRPVKKLRKEQEKNFPVFIEALKPLCETLKNQPFISGNEPLFPDYAAFSVFKWADLTSSLALQEYHSEISSWFFQIEAWYRERIVTLEDPPLF